MSTTSTFDADSISALAFDFTALPRQDGKGFCSGKGTIPEPSARQLAQFDLLVRSVSDYCPSPVAPAAQVEAVERSRVLAAIAEVAGEEGPTREQLEELHPLALRTFLAWLRHQLKSPTDGGVAGW
jgi:hypothetical protein